jgi:hypothetical protein
MKQLPFKKLSETYKTPKQVQKLLRSFDYNSSHSMKSALLALRARRAHCLEAAFLSAAILEHHGYPPLILYLDSSDNIGHVLYIFKMKTGWGAIGRSKEEGLHGRAPRFRTIRDLVWSYVDPYVDNEAKIRAFAVVNLDETESPWRYSKENVWKCERYILSSDYQLIRASRGRYSRALKRFRNGGHKRLDYWW